MALRGPDPKLELHCQPHIHAHRVKAEVKCGRHQFSQAVRCDGRMQWQFIYSPILGRGGGI